MSHSPPLDLIVSIKNGYSAGKLNLVAPFSRYSQDILDLLKKNQLILDFTKTTSSDSISHFEIKLLPNTNRFRYIKVFSKPGRRYYSTKSALPWGSTPSSIIIISTSKGVMTQKQAHHLGLGGEVLAEIT